MRKTAALFVVVLVSASMGWAQAKADAEPVLQADRDFNRATQAKHLEGWMEYMADNIVLGHGAQPAFGKEAVRKEMAYLNEADTSMTWEPTYGEVFPAGTVGFTTGKWMLKGKDKDGSEATFTGHYLTVWKKQQDGNWKVVWDGGAPDPKK